MNNHWHIVYVSSPMDYCVELFKQAGLRVYFPVFHQNYPGEYSEAAAYFDGGRGSIQSADPGRIIFQNNELLRYWRSLVPTEARTQIVLVTGDEGNPTACFHAWQEICSQLRIVWLCPRCPEDK